MSMENDGRHKALQLQMNQEKGGLRYRREWQLARVTRYATTFDEGFRGINYLSRVDTFTFELAECSTHVRFDEGYWNCKGSSPEGFAMALQRPESFPVVLESFSRLTFAKQKNCEYLRNLYGSKSILEITMNCLISNEGMTVQAFSKYLRRCSS